MSLDAQNQVMLRKLLAIVVLMLAFAFALVPFYRKICEVTGLNQTRAVQASAVNTQVDTSRLITIEFVASQYRGLDWKFEPLQTSMQIHPGAITQAVYRVQNTTGRPMVVQAVPSYGPALAARYFRKLECFCFKRQSFGPLETREMPVVFVVSPDLPSDVSTVTLSYTFFDVTAEAGGKG